LEGIQELDLVEECHRLEEDERLEKIDMSIELEKTLLFEEMNWRQKSRALWLKEGDKNKKLCNVQESCGELGEHIVHYYNNLYFEHCSWQPRVDGLSFLSIDADDSIWLEREFEENEVWDVIRDLNGDKASSPNGFTMAFFQKCWVILKSDLMAVFVEFHN